MLFIGRWVLTHTELEIAVHLFLLEIQLDGFSFRDYSAWLTLGFGVVRRVNLRAGVQGHREARARARG